MGIGFKWYFLLGALVVASCSKQESTSDLTLELAEQLQALPQMIRGVESADSAELVANKIDAMAGAVTSIAQRVEAGSYLSHEQRIQFEGSLRDVQDEAEYLLTKLSAQPELVIKLTEPLANLGDSLEFAASVMKQRK